MLSLVPKEVSLADLSGKGLKQGISTAGREAEAGVEFSSGAKNRRERKRNED